MVEIIANLSPAETIKQIFPIGILLIGVILLAVWLVRHRGLDRLTDAPTRRVAFVPTLPFWLFLVWLTAMAAGMATLGKWLDVHRPAGLLAVNGFVLALDCGLIGVVGILAYRTFSGRLTTFGLRLKDLPSDLFWAFVYLLAVWPLVVAGITAVKIIGNLITGGDFQIPSHQTLQDLQAHNHLLVRVLLTVLAALIVPVAEEMLFRGLIQTALRSVGLTAWRAIVICSLLFSAVHYSTHAVSIFFLSCCMGYAYEKSGSLFRSMAIHIYFNSFNILMSLLNA